MVLPAEELPVVVSAAVPAVSWDNPLDRDVMEFVVAHRSFEATALANAVMAAGTTVAGLVVLASLGAVVVITTRAWRSAVAGVLALVLAAIASGLLKSVFERPRPSADLALVLPAGWSFPSTQASETAALAVAVVLTAPWSGRSVSRTVTAVVVSATVLVAVCMVYLGAHWPTDVLGGWVLGAGIGALSARAVLAASRRRRPEKAEAIPAR